MGFTDGKKHPSLPHNAVVGIQSGCETVKPYQLATDTLLKKTSQELSELRP